MMFYMKLLSIVIAVSLDGFGVGMTYGMRKIRINIIGLAIIVSCSGIIVLISMTMGHMIRTFIPPYVTSMIGSFILIGLGLFVLFSIVRQNQSRKKRIEFLKHLKILSSVSHRLSKIRRKQIKISRELFPLLKQQY